MSGNTKEAKISKLDWEKQMHSYEEHSIALNNAISRCIDYQKRLKSDGRSDDIRKFIFDDITGLH